MRKILWAVLLLSGSVAALEACTSAGATSGDDDSEGGDEGESGSGGSSGAGRAGATSGGSTGSSGAGDAGASSAGEGGMSGGGGAGGSGGDGTPTTRTITITVTGVGAGTVTSSAGGSCGPSNETCELTAPAGASVTLTARPDGDDNGFLGWSGACTNRSTTCTIVVDDDLEVTARFTLLFDLSVRFERDASCGTPNAANAYVTTNVAGLSYMNCSACGGFICHARFAANTEVSITATPGVPASDPASCNDPGGVPTLADPAITGACTGNTQGGGFSTSPASCIVTMDSNKSIVVHTCQQSG